MRGRGAGAWVILTLYVLGAVCLLVLAVPYLAHDSYVANPDAMLPMERWEGCGLLLTLGLLPLWAVDALAFWRLGTREKRRVRLLWFLPAVLCLGIVAWFWGSGLAG